MVRAEREISDVIETIEISSWLVTEAGKGSPIESLEDGKVLFFHGLRFELAPEEQRFLSPTFADPKAKNISFNPANGEVKGAVGAEADIAAIRAMMRRYCETTHAFVERMLAYGRALRLGRTSFRPVEIVGRKTSARNDDRRLHVDAFPSTPTAGERILRIFSNVNSDGRGRHWRIGAPFDEVARIFAPAIGRPAPGSAWLLNAVGATKARRTEYDHIMLGLHDRMKADDAYQRDAVQNEFSFPTGSSWVVFTDKTSHAAMGGQHLFEQTFYLPPGAMADPAKAPLAILERLFGRPLI